MNSVRTTNVSTFTVMSKENISQQKKKAVIESWSKNTQKSSLPQPENEGNELIKCIFLLYYTKYNFIDVKVIEF